jgi:hypothetical protein
MNRDFARDLARQGSLFHFPEFDLEFSGRWPFWGGSDGDGYLLPPAN